MANLVELKVTGLDGVLDLLKKLPPEVVSKRGGPVRAALRKGALVIKKEAQANVRKIVAEPNIGGRNDLSTGELEKAIRVNRGKVPPGFKGEKAIVWLGKVTRKYANTKHNVRKQRVGQSYDLEPPQFYGRFLEYGTSRMRAHPWLRPAAETKAQEAVNAITKELVNRLNAIVKKLARK